MPKSLISIIAPIMVVCMAAPQSWAFSINQPSRMSYPSSIQTTLKSHFQEQALMLPEGEIVPAFTDAGIQQRHREAIEALSELDRTIFIDSIHPEPNAREVLAEFRLHRISRQEGLNRLQQLGITEIGLANAYLQQAAAPVAMADKFSGQRRISPISSSNIMAAVDRILSRGERPSKQAVAAELGVTAHNLQEWFRRYKADMSELGVVTGKAVSLSEISYVIASISAEGGRPTRSAVAGRIIFRGKPIGSAALVNRINDLGHTPEDLGIVSEEIITREGILAAVETLRRAKRRPTDAAVMRQMGANNSTFYRSIRRQSFDLAALGVLEKDTFRHHFRMLARSVAAARDQALNIMDHWEIGAINALRLRIQGLLSALRTERKVISRSTWRPRMDRLIRRLRLTIDLTEVPMRVKRGNLFIIAQLLDQVASGLSTPIGRKPKPSPSLKDAFEKHLKDIQKVVAETKNRQHAIEQLDQRLGLRFSNPNNLTRFLYMNQIAASWQEPRHDEKEVRRYLKDTQSLEEALQICKSQLNWTLQRAGIEAYLRRHHIEVSWYKPNPSSTEVQTLIQGTKSIEDARAVLLNKLGWDPGKNFKRYMEDHSLEAPWYHARIIAPPMDDELFHGVLVRDIKAALAKSINSERVVTDLERLGWKTSPAGLNYHLNRFGWETPWRRKKSRNAEKQSA